MKKLLPLLLAYVFLTTQGWALSGGPVFSSGDTSTTIGTYAGVLTPNNLITSATGLSTLGVFSLGVPQTGVASGLFVYFSSGKTYSGTIIGIADPDELTFQGLVKAQFNVDINTILVTTTGSASQAQLSFPAGYASGAIQCDILPTGQATGTSNTFGLAIRIEGTANLAVQDADVTTGQPTGAITSLSLNVDGFKQSLTADVTADLSSFGVTQTQTGG